MSDLTTLSRLLSSQEARDAAPCVPVTGPWGMFRNGLIEGGWDVAYWQGRPSQTPNSARDRYDLIWSGDLPGLLAELIAGEQQLGQQWELLQDVLQERDARIACLEAKLARAREGLSQAAMKVSGGLCYFTKEAKHEQLRDAAKVIDATLQELDQ